MYSKIPLKDLEKIQLITTNCKKTVAQVKKETGCDFVMNCTLYNYNTLKPCCVYKENGKVITISSDGYWCYAWNSGADIKMVHSTQISGYKNAIACSAMLKDGKETILNYNADQGGVRGRSAIGLSSSGELVLFCSKDGTKDAQTPEKLVKTMKNLGCVSAIMLDSGTSSSCDFQGKLITSKRKVANYILVFLKKTNSNSTTTNKTTTPTTTTKTNPYTKPTRNLRLWSTGNDVKWLQYALNREGYNCGTVDGIFGSNTQKQVKAFQKAKGLDADGIVGPKTREALV